MCRVVYINYHIYEVQPTLHNVTERNLESVKQEVMDG